MREFNVSEYDKLDIMWMKSLIRENETEGVKWHDLSDTELIRWIYLELGKKFSFSRKYRYATNAKEKNDIENDANDAYNPRNYKYIPQKRVSRLNDCESVICIDIEEAMRILLEDIFNIRTYVEIDGSGPHVYLRTKADEGMIRLDLQEDLTNIKAGRKTEKFAMQDQYDGRYFRTISEEELRRIDKKLGYIGEDGLYSDEKLERYKSNIDSEESLSKKLEKVFTLVSTTYFEQLKNMKYCERTELFKKVIKDMIPDTKIEHRTFRSNGKMMSCFIIPDEDGTQKYFIYDKDKKQYTETSEEEYKKYYEENEQAIKDGNKKGLKDER